MRIIETHAIRMRVVRKLCEHIAKAMRASLHKLCELHTNHYKSHSNRMRSLQKLCRSHANCYKSDTNRMRHITQAMRIACESLQELCKSSPNLCKSQPNHCGGYLQNITRAMRIAAIHSKCYVKHKETLKCYSVCTVATSLFKHV